ncbi:MAG: hypothetical protein RJB66_468 [Pseudomonadota bacterium]|jgi:protein-disulfide isomerase/uncharacterized membrane protein
MRRQTSSTLNMTLALITSLAALAVHFYLTKHFHELHLGLSSGSAACNINKTFNCDAVSASNFSSLGGIPIALWGLTTQIVLLILTLTFVLGLSSKKDLVGRCAAYLSAFIAVASIVMGAISLAFLQAYCLFCLFAYALSFVNFYALWNLNDRVNFNNLAKDLKDAASDFKWIGILTAGIVPLTFLLNSMILDNYGGSLIKDAAESSFYGWQGNPDNNFSEEGLSKGPAANARMTIVEFADFLCPHCKHAYPSLKVFADSHPDVRVIYKLFPLDGNCNAATEMPKGDGTRCLLAKTAYCAEKLGQKGLAVYEAIFNKQEEFHGAGNAANLVKTIVEDNGLDNNRMEECRNSEETHNKILQQSQEGLSAKIEGTPTIFVNGKHLSRGQLLPVLQRVYNSL